MTDGLVREPGESLVRFYNRRLVHSGRDDVVWITTAGGQLRLVERDKRQSRMDFEGAEDAR